MKLIIISRSPYHNDDNVMNGTYCPNRNGNCRNCNSNRLSLSKRMIWPVTVLSFMLMLQQQQQQSLYLVQCQVIPRVCNPCETMRRMKNNDNHRRRTNDNNVTMTTIVSLSNSHNLISMQMDPIFIRSEQTIMTDCYSDDINEDFAETQQLVRTLQQTNGTSAANRTFSILDGGRDCSVSCTPGSEFCGNDGMCHATSCYNFYLYGNSNYTGNMNNQDDNMTCTSIDQIVQVINEEVAEFPVAMIHSCANQVPTCLPNDEIASNSLFYTRRCRAYPADNITFTCYDLKPDTNFTVYKLNNLDNTTGYDCSYDNNGDLLEGEVPTHRYGISLARIDYTPDNLGCRQVATNVGSDIVEEDLAFGTISSVVVIGEESTTIAPTPVTNKGMSSSQSVYSSSSFFIMCGCYFLAFLVL